MRRCDQRRIRPLQVIFRQLEVVGGETPDRALLRKITPSLVTLLAAEPEIQCVPCRARAAAFKTISNIHLHSTVERLSG